MKKAYAICRFAKLSMAGLRLALAHNQRTVSLANADPARKANNLDLLAHDGRTPMQRWEERMTACGNPPLRANAVVAIEKFYGYSPEAAAWIDPLKWSQACAAFEERHFGEGNIISLPLHADEKTPHMQPISIPLVLKSIRGREPEWRLCASEWMDGPAKLRHLQTLFYEEVGKEFGLERGELGSKRKHVPQKEMYRLSNNIETFVEDVVKSIPVIKASESEAAHHKNIEIHLRRHLTELSEAAKQAALTQSANRAVAATEQKREQEYQLRKRAEEDRDRARHDADKTRKEYQDRIRDLPVSSVLECVMGIRPGMEGDQRVFETPTIKLVVHSDERRFSIFKGSKPGGSGAISAVMQATDCSFKEAVRWLAAHFTHSEIESSVRLAYEATIRRTVKEADANPISLAEKLEKYAPVVEANWRSVREYLVRVRCLPARWIDGLHRRGRIWANNHQSACFGHRDRKGNIVGVSIRGTTSRFYQTIGNKDDGFFSFRLTRDIPHRIAVVESPIEAISLAHLERDPLTTYASTAGAGGLQAVLALARQFDLSVVAGQNHDAAGEVQALRTAEICSSDNLTCIRVRPPFNDWNDTLRYLHSERRHVLNGGAAISNKLRAIWRKKFYSKRPVNEPSSSILLLPEPTNNANTTLSI